MLGYRTSEALMKPMDQGLKYQVIRNQTLVGAVQRPLEADWLNTEGSGRTRTNEMQVTQRKVSSGRGGQTQVPYVRLHSDITVYTHTFFNQAKHICSKWIFYTIHHTRKLLETG